MPDIVLEPIGRLTADAGEWEDTAVIELARPVEPGANYVLVVVAGNTGPDVLLGRIDSVEDRKVIVRGYPFPPSAEVLGLVPYRRWHAVHHSPSLLDEVDGEDRRKLFFRLACNFHGEACVGVGLGVRTALKAAELLPVPLQHREVRVECHCQPCMADALQGICAARNKRLRRRAPLSRESVARFELTSRTLEIRLTSRKIERLDEALSVPDDQLFSAVEWTG